MNEMSRNYNQRYGNPVRERPSVQMTQRISALPFDAAVAMAYVPVQTDTSMYDEMKALSEGTLFPVLNKPFAGAGDCR